MNRRTKLQLFQIASFAVGFGWLLFIDGRIAICVLLTHWANNVRVELESGT